MSGKASIRLRLTLWYSAVLFLGLALFGAGLWFALQHRLLRAVDLQLTQRVQGMRTVLEVESEVKDRAQLQVELSEFAQEIPDGTLIQLRDAAGDLLPAPPERFSFPEIVRARLPAYSTSRQHGRSFRILAAPIERGGQSYVALVAAPLREVNHALEDLRDLLLLMIPAVLLAAGAGGFWLSRRALAPVDEITRVARSIGAQNLSRRLAVPRTGDELQRMSEAWNEVLERLEAAFNRVGQFTANASHELRTPLALIRTQAELALRQKREPEEYRNALRSVVRESERMTELTESLLALARLDSGGLETPMAAADLNHIVNEVVRESAAAAQARGITLRAATIARPAVVRVNETGIARLLFILIDNALKHTPSGGTVCVSTAAPPAGEGAIVLAVEDNGEGIAPDVAPHVFERFFRADAARTSGSGVGLGLSIAQAIARAHGSEIAVETSPGAGARFFLTLK